MNKDYKNIIIFGIGVAAAIGFIYLISPCEPVPDATGMYVEILEEGEYTGTSNVHTVSRESLEKYPRLLMMIDLIIEEKENPKESRDVLMGFYTYSIQIENSTAFKINNYMTDKATYYLTSEFQYFNGNPIIFEGNMLSIYRMNPQ